MTKLCLEDLGGEMSLSLLTRQALSKGDVVMSVPISLCMTNESVRGRAKEDMLELEMKIVWVMEREQVGSFPYVWARRTRGEGNAGCLKE